MLLISQQNPSSQHETEFPSGTGSIARPRVAARRVAGGDSGQDDPGTVRVLDPHLGRALGPGRRFPDDHSLAAASPACSVRSEITGVLSPSDPALFGDPAWMKQADAGFPAMFAHGLQGYTDDRLADGGGWVTFDVRSIRCPVIVLHGGSDRMVDVIHAHHTAEVVPGAELVVFDDDGHFSIVTEVVPAISDLLRR